MALATVVRWLSRWPPFLRVSRWLPGPMRARVRAQVNDLSRRRAVYDLPIHLSFPEVVTEPEPHFRVIVFGAFFSNWNPALIDEAVWRKVAGVVEVVRVIDASEIAALPPSPARTVVIPLGEDHIRRCPIGYRTLIPSAAVLETLSNKARFASFMEEAGLSALCPKRYLSRQEAVFPCMLKRLDQHAGYGVEFIGSAEQLAARLRSDVFVHQEYLLQAYVSGGTEYTSHFVCNNGEILWSLTVSSTAAGPEPHVGVDRDTAVPVTPLPEVLSQVATVLKRLRYSGPCCANYKILPSGKIALFEINPRFGGSLMVRRNRKALSDALNCLVVHARQSA